MNGEDIGRCFGAIAVLHLELFVLLAISLGLQRSVGVAKTVVGLLRRGIQPPDGKPRTGGFWSLPGEKERLHGRGELP
jgi:CO/xanthine dehydrogenase Mo-binding subunit